MIIERTIETIQCLRALSIVSIWTTDRTLIMRKARNQKGWMPCISEIMTVNCISAWKIAHPETIQTERLVISKMGLASPQFNTVP